MMPCIRTYIRTKTKIVPLFVLIDPDSETKLAGKLHPTSIFGSREEFVYHPPQWNET